MTNQKHPIDWSNIVVSVHDNRAVTAAKVMDTVPKDLRWLIRRDGTKTLQGGYLWYQGVESGVEWKDIPTIVEEHPDKL